MTSACTQTTAGGRDVPSNSQSEGDLGINPTRLTTDDICGRLGEKSGLNSGEAPSRQPRLDLRMSFGLGGTHYDLPSHVVADGHTVHLRLHLHYAKVGHSLQQRHPASWR